MSFYLYISHFLQNWYHFHWFQVSTKSKIGRYCLWFISFFFSGILEISCFKKVWTDARTRIWIQIHKTAPFGRDYELFWSKSISVNLSDLEETLLEYALLSKMCHCIQKMSHQQNFQKLLISNNKKGAKSFSKVCRHSIYTRRKLKTPKKIRCGKSFSWYHQK